MSVSDVPDEFDEWWDRIESLANPGGPAPPAPPPGATSVECDQFNQALLGKVINALRAKGSAVTSSGFQTLYRLSRLRSSLDNSSGLLLKLDPRGDGMAVVAVGDPDTATCTTILVPGIDNNLGTMDAQINRAQVLVTAAQDRLSTPARACVVAWLGYDPPQEFEPEAAAAAVRARCGGQALSAFVHSLRAQGASQCRVTVEGHGYGSVVVGEAASSEQGLDVEDIVVVGSPGMGARTISELRIDPEHVWAGAAVNDPMVNDFGGVLFGPSPTEKAFGANRFTVDTGGHSNYWKPDSASLRNQVSIIVGKYTDVELDWGPRGSKGNLYPDKDSVEFKRNPELATIPLKVEGVRAEEGQPEPIIVLRDEGARYLCIWTGRHEGSAIVYGLRKMSSFTRPMTHDLMINIINRLSSVEMVAIPKTIGSGTTELAFGAVVRLRANGIIHDFPARPSDAVALAVRLEMPIYTTAEIMNEFGQVVPGEEREK